MVLLRLTAMQSAMCFRLGAELENQLGHRVNLQSALMRSNAMSCWQAPSVLTASGSSLRECLADLGDK